MFSADDVLPTTLWALANYHLPERKTVKENTLQPTYGFETYNSELIELQIWFEIIQVENAGDSLQLWMVRTNIYSFGKLLKNINALGVKWMKMIQNENEFEKYSIIPNEKHKYTYTR